MRKSLDLDQVISATQVPMVSASEPSLNRRHSKKSQREVRGSDQKGHGHTGVESINAVLDFTPLTRRIEVSLRYRKTCGRNGVTSEVALSGGRYREQGATRKPLRGRITEEANASGKARG